jgi:hypothetical protein
VQQWSVAATQNGVTVSGSIPVQVNVIPTGVSFTPSAASLPDNAAAGTVVASGFTDGFRAISGVRTYERALSATETLALYHAVTGTTCNTDNNHSTCRLKAAAVHHCYRSG